MDSAYLILIHVGVFLIIVAFIASYFIDKHKFNNGKCPKCGADLKYIDTDVEGNRYYVCPKCKNYSTSISNVLVDKNFLNKE